jgi:hypothetical protein
VPILRDFERRLEGLVEGFFAKTFRSGLQPVELAKRLLRQMDAGKTVGVRGVWAPNRFVFRIAEPDRERFGQAESALVAELQQVVRDGAAERGWGLVGPPQVVFETDPRLGKGEFRCEATLVAADGKPVTEPGAAGSQRARLLLLEAGDTTRAIQLEPGTSVIGRLPECDIVLTDPGASRRHAQIRGEDGTFTLTDLGSTNGTLVNGEPITRWILEEGDRITIGETVLEFRRG